MEQRLLNVMGGEYVGSAILMDRLSYGAATPQEQRDSGDDQPAKSKGSAELRRYVERAIAWLGIGGSLVLLSSSGL